MKKELIVMIGDLVGSSKVDQRRILQRRLVKAYKDANLSFKRDLHAPIKITHGDEIAGVVKSPINLYNIATQLLEGIYPHRMRFAFVRGKLTAGLETKDAAIIDGPAFKKAGENISLAKSAKNDFIFDFGNSTNDEILNSLANLIAEVKCGWTERQREIVKLYAELKNLKQVAGRMKVTQQSATEILGRTPWKKVCRAEETINYILAAHVDTT